MGKDVSSSEAAACGTFLRELQWDDSKATTITKNLEDIAASTEKVAWIWGQRQTLMYYSGNTHILYLGDMKESNYCGNYM